MPFEVRNAAVRLAVEGDRFALLALVGHDLEPVIAERLQPSDAVGRIAIGDVHRSEAARPGHDHEIARPGLGGVVSGIILQIDCRAFGRFEGLGVHPLAQQRSQPLRQSSRIFHGVHCERYGRLVLRIDHQRAAITRTRAAVADDIATIHRVVDEAEAPARLAVRRDIVHPVHFPQGGGAQQLGLLAL